MFSDQKGKKDHGVELIELSSGYLGECSLAPLDPFDNMIQQLILV